jgi:arylsulfatase A-like enzyme
MTSLTRREFIVGSAGILGACGLGGCQRLGRGLANAVHGDPRPNILFLLTDDQRWDTLGCMGNTFIRTPHIDALAREGTIFANNFVTTSICCTSRASIFTGMYGRSCGVEDFTQDLAPEVLARTYFAQLRAAGYRTGFIGKYSVGVNLPSAAFDYWAGFPEQGTYFHQIGGQKVHLTDLMGDQAVEFLDGCAAGTPFCLSMSFKAPHVEDLPPDYPFLPAPRYDALYEDVEIPRPPTADAEHFAALPEFLRNGEGRLRWSPRFDDAHYQESVRKYYRLITGVDDVVGRIRDALVRLKLDGNTIVIFTSDNGYFLGDRGLTDKWTMHEQSIRTPMIVFDPRTAAAARIPRVERMTLNIDLAPTMLDLAGAPVPATMQGHSLRPLLSGEKIQWRQDWFYEHLLEHPGIPKCEGVRTARYKYVRWIQTDPRYEELYDLERDPLEEVNRVKDREYRVILERLRDRWREYRAQLPDPRRAGERFPE